MHNLHKKILLLFLSFLLLLTGCSENTAPTEATDTKQRENTTSHTDETTPAGIDATNIESPEDEETDEPTEDPEETLNNILRELHELEELMNGT